MPEALDKLVRAPVSLRPKMDAAVSFVRAIGKFADIGQLTDARAIIKGHAGSRVQAIAAQSC